MKFGKFEIDHFTLLLMFLIVIYFSDDVIRYFFWCR